MNAHPARPSPVARAVLPLVGVLLAGLPLAGCSAPADWQTIPTQETAGDVWRALVEVARIQRYEEDPLETDRGLREFTSKWKTSTAVFVRSAKRSRLHARINRDPEDDTTWLVEFHVEAQNVTRPGRGMRPTERDWSQAGQDPDEEDQIRGLLNARLGRELGVTPVFQRR